MPEIFSHGQHPVDQMLLQPMNDQSHNANYPLSVNRTNNIQWSIYIQKVHVALILEAKF